jgi:hypothetical protein
MHDFVKSTKQTLFILSWHGLVSSKVNSQKGYCEKGISTSTFVSEVFNTKATINKVTLVKNTAFFEYFEKEKRKGRKMKEM